MYLTLLINDKKNQVATLDPSSRQEFVSFMLSYIFLCHLRRRDSLSGLMGPPTTGQKLTCPLCRPIRRTALLFSGMPRAQDTFSRPFSATSPYPTSANTKVTTLFICIFVCWCAMIMLSSQLFISLPNPCRSPFGSSFVCL